jgi:L-lactate utilization protein LutB
MVTGSTGLVEQFKTEASKAGAIVYQATSAEDAVGYVLKLAGKHSVKNAVKSKSSLANEINLRENLENAGISVVDADLKEWLAQLAGEKPRGRKTIGQVQKLVSEAAGKRLNPDPRILLDSANQIIRQCCINADLGISEADIAIAETGTLVITGNEGVTRLVAVLPRIHLTLIKSQNVVPLMEDVFMKLGSLDPDAGQVVPNYITYITGRNTTADIPGAVLARAQGPIEEHIILLDKPDKRRTP